VQQRVFFGKSEGKRLRGRSKLRWEDIIKTDLKCTGWDGVTEFIWLTARARGAHGGLL
jgi:hypothetical protein